MSVPVQNGSERFEFRLDLHSGVPVYRQKCDEVAARGYEGFALTAAKQRQTAAAS